MVKEIIMDGISEWGTTKTIQAVMVAAATGAIGFLIAISFIPNNPNNKKGEI